MSAVAEAPNDADLVQRCLAEGAGAFAEIVARYQTLVCSLTYNATGSLSRSEDLAQEVFLTAWKELRQLREPEKLRPWLCGIARRLGANTRRREGREPVCAAEELEDEHQEPARGPVEEAISREEAAILWRSLERIPENYREPLILFYREGKSVEHVAAALELTEDTAKQRLSRGRKLLQEQVALFVEGALRMSTPGRAFTLGVLASLPLMKTSAAAATLGTAAAKSGVSIVGIGVLGVCSALLGPVAGGLGAWFGIKASLDSAESAEERKLIRGYATQMIALVLGFLVFWGLAIPFQNRLGHDYTWLAVTLVAGVPILYGALLAILIVRFKRAHSRLVKKRTTQPDARLAARRAEAWKTFEYKSAWTLLGLPLVHIRTGRQYGEKLRPAVGWIAIGDMAIGVLVAVGGLSVGGISIGGASLGLMAIGGASLGVFAFAGIALGLWGATGGLAIAYYAHGACALGWHAAEGGMAAARDFAVGQNAYATHTNNDTARQAIDAIPFFNYANTILRYPILFSVAWLPLLLTIWQTMRARRVLRKVS
ncbi:MAG: sigma-70 family RNA polymerase sigma factor [Chthoniobacter sp.]|uniref:RNA polymerase sigma factor n=1 Tax=Chthoniobacter sp. TaxID=2510640 RepID=UPI0032ABEADC